MADDNVIKDQNRKIIDILTRILLELRLNKLQLQKINEQMKIASSNKNIMEVDSDGTPDTLGII